MTQPPTLTRRALLGSVAAAGAVSVLRPLNPAARPAPMLTRPIPSTGEKLPLVGLGSWITFNVGDDVVGRDSCAEVIRAFFQGGGRLIDSSPMYGSSQEVIGYGLHKLGNVTQLFAADKVWISSAARGPEQIEESRRHWGIPRFDLLQVHNLMSWEEHLPKLFAMKAAGRLRYVGVTRSNGSCEASRSTSFRSPTISSTGKWKIGSCRSRVSGAWASSSIGRFVEES
jgi:aryl-alcohol dehydrogenase-like predicted oxidoreductase